jgi:hypothetical protein
MADLRKKWVSEDFQGLAIKNIAAPVDNTDPATKGSAQAQADAAKDAAINAAALDATAKANAAQSAAVSAAATDAGTKAATAKSEAIAAAAEDATSKAATAENNANSYTDNEITALVGGASGAYDTLKELQTALQTQDDAVIAITNSLAGKTNKFAANITGTPTAVEGNYEYLVQHDLNKADVIAQAFDGNDQVDVFIRKVNNNSLKVITGVALGATTIRVVVVG